MGIKENSCFMVYQSNDRNKIRNIWQGLFHKSAFRKEDIKIKIYYADLFHNAPVTALLPTFGRIISQFRLRNYFTY